MYKSFKYRIYPTDPQKELISKHIGASRFVYNLALETKINAYLSAQKTLSAFDLINQLTDLKNDCPWLRDVGSESMQQSIIKLEKSFKNFFNGAGHPKYKSKKCSKQSFTVLRNIIIEDNLVSIAKFREGIKAALHRPIEGVIKSATISVSSTGKYFISLACHIDEEPSRKPIINEKTAIGIDLGIKNFAITSEGEVFKNPTYLRKAQSKLKYTQRKYSKYKGKRTKQKLALLHEKVANKRRDFLQKTSTKLIRENQTIALEKLDVMSMLKNKNIAGLISDAGWYTFGQMMEYKAEWYGRNILRINRFEPSSKTCSNCGNINQELTLKDREWTCEGCNTVLDRDINAACNIKSFALKNLSGGHTLKNQDELPRLRGVMTPESLIGKSTDVNVVQHT